MQSINPIVKVQFELDRLIYQYQSEPCQELLNDTVARSVLDSLPAMGKNRRRLFWIGYLLGVLRVLRAGKVNPICEQRQEGELWQALER